MCAMKASGREPRAIDEPAALVRSDLITSMPMESNNAPASAPQAALLGDSAQTLVELLERRADEGVPAAGYTFLLDGECVEQHLDYAALRVRARALAATLPSVDPGQRALILLSPGIDFIVAFFASMYAGCVAVPLPLPQGKRGLARVMAVIGDCRPALALTTREAMEKGDLERNYPGIRWVAVDDDSARAGQGAREWRPPRLSGESPAFLQYTSGSTATPKGVILTHANLLHNERMIAQAFGHDESSVVVGWLPPHHDMGLIGNILQPLYLGVRCVQMAPQHFLLRPLRWLAAISRYRGTTSGGPNFAYDLCVKKISPAERAELDLSSWRVAFNGAEPVRAATLERFAEAFAASGFRRSASYPCYGLAEATLFVTGGQVGRSPLVAHVDRDALERGRVAAAEAGAAGALPLVGCGETRAGATVAIAQPSSSERLADGEVGEIWIGGASVAVGYWQRGAENAEVFGARLSDGSGPYLRTGDLGFMRGGELFVTGRLKDLIIVRGRNLYPQDLEMCAEGSHPSLRDGGACAFAVEGGGEERVVLVHEVTEGVSQLADVAQAVRRAVAQRHEVALHEIVFIKQGALPRTTSGKLQRRACRGQLQAGELPVVWRSGASNEAGTTVHGDLPREGLEAELALLWCDVLGFTTIGRHDQFSSLGGDSLKAMQMIARVRERYDVEIDAALLFDAATVASLAAELEQRSGSIETSADDRSGALGDADALAAPLSPIQERLWFMEQLAGGAPVYNIAVAALARGALDVAALGRAVADVTARHAMLRARFVASEGHVEQRFDGPEAPPITRRQLSGGDPTATELALREEAARPFGSLEEPPVRWTLFSASEHEHALTLVCHHLLVDGWAMNIVQRDLWLAYRARASGHAPTWPATSPSYASYVRWQRGTERQARAAADLAYWQSKLQGSGAVLELPTDRPRGAVQSYAGARAELRLDATLRGALEKLARREGVTLFNVLATALFGLAYRMTGQTDVCIGMPVAGRPHARLLGLVGCCLNTLPLRASVNGEQSLASLLSKVTSCVREALAHQEASFERILAGLPLERDLSRPPLFQWMLSLQPELGALPELPGLSLDVRQLDVGAAQFDLALDVALEGGGARVAWEYPTDLFDAQTVHGLAAGFRSLLEALAERPTLRLCEVALGGEGPRAMDVESAEAPDVIAAFQAHVASEPRAVALRRDETSISYAELDQMSDRVALRLAGLGIGREQRVAMYLSSSPELVACVLGTLKAGAAYVPLDPHQPRASALELLRDAGVAGLVTDAATAAACADVPVRVWSVEQLLAEDAPPAPRQLPPVASRQLAYVVYTSGSTGRPKGVLVTRGALNGAARAWQAAFVGRPGEWRGLTLANPAFDVWTADWVRALASGGTLVFASPEQALDPVALTALMDAEHVSAVDLVPSLLRPVLDYWERAGTAMTSLRWCIVGSETWPLCEYRRLRACLPRSARVVSCYGVTEATIDSAWFEEQSDASLARSDTSSTPLGWAFAGSQLVVLDRDGRPAPSGASGELAIGGDGVARGYLGNPRLTAERFVPHAGSDVPGARLYRTGDRVRLGRDGALEFLGRFDHQLKVRGRRVEPGEVEQQLAAHPAVRQCVVILRAEGSLVAYLVPRTQSVPVGELRAFLRERLAEALVPASFVWLDALPLNKNGKLDRKALPVPRADGQHARELPGSALERQIAAVWCEVLGVDAVGTRDNFFDLGGHSLLLTRVLGTLRETVAPELTMLTLFRHPTVHGLAAALASGGHGLDTTPPVRERTEAAAPRRAELRARRRRAQEGKQ
jgi:amino acid adenylation domain-containing protein